MILDKQLLLFESNYIHDAKIFDTFKYVSENSYLHFSIRLFVHWTMYLSANSVCLNYTRFFFNISFIGVRFDFIFKSVSNSYSLRWVDE